MFAGIYGAGQQRWVLQQRLREEVARAGDNLFAASVVAVDANTGQYRWHFQTPTCPSTSARCSWI